MNPKSLIPSLVIIITTIISSCGDNYQPESYPYSEVTIKDSVYYRNNKKIEYGNIFILEKNSDSTVLEIIGGELNYKKRYNKGEKEDFTEDWYWTGGTVKKSYKNGEANGPSEEYDENGKLNSKGTYQNDEKDGVWESYDKNGNLSQRITYVNDKKNGPEINFREDGRIHYVYTYKNDKKEGLYESFDINNKNEFVVRSMYKNDKEDGVREFYGRNNVIYKTETYRNGIKIDSNRLDRSVRINSIYPKSVYLNLNGSNNNSQSSGGVYTYESGYRRMKITITPEKWFGWLEDGSGDGNYSGKSTIGGKMNGSDLYDEYGTEKRGYVSGNTIYYNDPLGQIKLSK
jgi:antitoxin component YwqK of YwqJK toxin-antitoxin module